MYRRAWYAEIWNGVLASLIIVGLTEASFAPHLNNHSMLFMSLLIYFPGIFFIQGVVAVLLRSRAIVSLGLSCFIFWLYFVVMHTDGQLDPAAYLYIGVYLLIGMVGFYISAGARILWRRIRGKE